MPENTINRRDWLKATGVAGVGALAPTQLVDAIPTGDEIGSRHFVEVALSHENAPETGRIHADDFVDYALDQENGKLSFSRVVSRPALETVRENDGFLKARGYQPLGSTVSGWTDDAGNLAATPGVDMSPAEELQPVSLDRYEEPSVRVTPTGSGEVRVSGDGADAVVPAGTTETFRFAEQTVTIRRRTDEFVEVEDPRAGGTTVRPVYETVDLVVTPVATVANHGTVTVHEPAETIDEQAHDHTHETGGH